MKKMTSIFRTLHKAYSVALVGIAALAVAGCSIKDDEFNMINEENSKLYTIDHTNEDADQVHRGYKSTNYAHAGGLVNIHFDSISNGTYGDGVMGLIFGLDGSKNARNFYVIGIRNKKDYYVSQYTNVSNLNGNNFGVADGDGAEEVIIKNLNTALPADKISTSNGLDVTVFYRDVIKNSTEHTYEIYFLTPDEAYTVATDTDGNAVVKNGSSDVELGTAAVTIDYNCTSDSFTQRKFAPYANVYPATANCSADYKANKATGTGTVKGSWTIQGDFKAAELEEDW